MKKTLLHRWRDRFASILLVVATVLAQEAPAGVFAATTHAQDPAPKQLPLAGETLLVEGHTAFVIPAGGNSATKERPWVWYAPTLPGLPGQEERWMFERFLEAGIAVAGIDVGESYGSPAGRAVFTSFHREMTRRGYSSKPLLLGRSRGGLMTLSWAVEHPDLVGGFAGIYPVCNLASYPGVAKAAEAYAIPAGELQAHLEEFNPIDRLAPLAEAGVPLFAIHGDADTVVPLKENSGLVRDRYTALGGSMQLVIPPGQGHNMWPGFFENQALVSFVKAHAGPNLTVLAPVDYQVVQRTGRNSGSLSLGFELAGIAARSPQEVGCEARLIVEGKPSAWRPVQADATARSFRSQWTVPAGGWHRLEIRALCQTNVIAEAVVEHVGVGEVFVVAGQSNSANHGAEKQDTKTHLVAAFDGRKWRLAHDPEPGASGAGGSFMPPFGDAIVARFHVPVGIVACGVGATSVREWLPKGAAFPNPPTLTNQVQQRPDGTWESKGTIFAKFTERMKQLGPGGFGAVLWHQGESDANQEDPARTLSGELYREYLEKLISDSRREIGWNAPWFVAQASYHRPGDEGSANIRAAQASTWKDGVALEGPDTDALRGDLRDNGGQGVHFSGPGLREHAARWAEKVGLWLDQNRTLSKGDVVYQADFESTDVLSGWTGTAALEPGFASPHAVALEAKVAGPGAVIAKHLPAEALRGCRIRASAMVRAEKVSPKPNPWNGVKCMLIVEGAAGKSYPQAPLETGTFAWQRAAFTARVPEDATTVTLVLGLEQVSGKAWFDDLQLTVAKAPITVQPSPVAGPIYKGHSLPRLRGAMVSPGIDPGSLRVLGQDWKANLIRFQLIRTGRAASTPGPDQYDAWLQGELKRLDAVLPLCERYGLLVVVDLHSPPGGRRTAGGYSGSDGGLFSDRQAQEKFVEVWRHIAARYKDAKPIWGYDLANEPVEDDLAEDCDDWQALAERAARAIRAVDPERTIIVEPAQWGSPEGLNELAPIPVSNVVYSVHMYLPHAFTHQGVYGRGPAYRYPGLIEGKQWDKAQLERALAPVMAFQERYRVHIYVGEFSAIRWAPNNTACRYLSDLIDIFEAHGWDWSYHAFREWSGWSVEHSSDREETKPAASATERQRLLRDWFARNQKPGRLSGARGVGSSSSQE